MKKLILGSTLAVAFAVGAFAQGTVTLDNSANTSLSTSATANGLVWIGANVGSAVLLGSPTDPYLAQSAVISGNPGEDDVNVQLLGGSSAGSLSVISTWLYSDTTAFGDNIYALAPTYGVLLDPLGATLAVPNVAVGTTATLEVLAWTGNYNTYAAAAAAGQYVGTTGAFSNPTGGNGAPPAPPSGLGGLPALVLTPVPEPTTFAMMGLGLASVLAFRRRK